MPVDEVTLTLTQLLDKLGFPVDHHRHASMRNQVKRWCTTKPYPRPDRPNPSIRYAKLVEGRHWNLAAGVLRFTQEGFTVARGLCGAPHGQRSRKGTGARKRGV